MAEAAQAALKKLEDQLNCPVCLDTYTNPKQLQCHHIYCQQCLRRLVERDQQGQLVLICPNCRQVTPVPANGVAGLPAAFHINNLLELRDTLEEQKKAKEGVLYCADHQETQRELELYCESCEQLICFQCTITEHRSHNYSLVKNVFETQKQEFKTLLAPAKERLSAVRKASQQVKALKKEVLDQQATLKAKMYLDKQRLIDIITARTNENVDKLQRTTDEKVIDLDSQVEQLDTIETQLSSGVDMVEETLTTGTPGKTVSAIARKVKELTISLQTDTLEPVTQADMEYLISNEVVEVCQNYGEVSVSMPPDPSMCRTTGKGLKVATVMEKSSAVLQAFDFKGQPLKKLIRSSECELVSDMTGSRTRGSVERTGQSQYEINYQPTVIGKHQLHIKVEAQHIRGSPFTVQVTRPDLKKLGTPLRTIDGVKEPFGVAINQRGEVLVTECGRHCVSIFSSSGQRLRFFGTRGYGHGQFSNPAGITVTSDGSFLVVDYGNHRIQKFSADGQFFTAVGTKGSNPLQFSSPRGIAFNKSNNMVYVVDTENSRVQILNSDLTFSSTFGQRGYVKGMFRLPFGITCDRSGNVYITDRLNWRIQVFTAEGKFLRIFGEGRVKLKGPTDIAIDNNDMVYVVSDSTPAVHVFTSGGQLVTSFGRQGRGEGEFFGVAVDNSGVLYLCDYSSNCVQLL